MNGRLAIQTTRTKSHAAERAQGSRSGEIEVIQAEPPKYLVAMRRVVINPDIKGILIVVSRTIADEVVRNASTRRSRKFRQNGSGLRRNHSNRNEVPLANAIPRRRGRPAKWRTPCSRQWVSGSGIVNEAVPRRDRSRVSRQVAISRRIARCISCRIASADRLCV